MKKKCDILFLFLIIFNQNFNNDKDNFEYDITKINALVFGALGMYTLYEIGATIFNQVYKSLFLNKSKKTDCENAFLSSNIKEYKQYIEYLQKQGVSKKIANKKIIHDIKNHIDSFLEKKYQNQINTISDKNKDGTTVFITKSPYLNIEEELDEIAFHTKIQKKLQLENIYYIDIKAAYSNPISSFYILKEKIKDEQAIYIINKKSILDFFYPINENNIKTNFLYNIASLFLDQKKSILIIESGIFDNINSLFNSSEFVYDFKYEGLDSKTKIIIINLLIKSLNFIAKKNEKINNINIEIKNLSVCDIIELINTIIQNKERITKEELTQILTKFNKELEKKKEKINNLDYIELNNNSDNEICPIMIKDFSFHNILGYTSIKNELSKIIQNTKRKIKQKLPGLVLYGPPGNGKTQFVKAIANEMNIPILIINATNIMSKYPGGSEKNINNIFNIANENSPCIVFIDEADTIFAKRNEYQDNSLINHFLQILDGINELRSIFLIIATNNLDALEPAILRPGRLSKKLYIGLPTKTDRIALVDHYASNYQICISDQNDLDIIINQLEGFSCADIKYFFEYISDELYIENKSQKILENEIENILNLNNFSKYFKSFLQQTNSNQSLFKYFENKEFENLAGYEEIKEELEEIAETLKNQFEIKTKLDGIIFTGNPGVGKTQFAKALAGISGLPMIVLESKDIFNKYIGESERKVYELFQLIRKNAPCIVFIDEIENIFLKRGQNENALYRDEVVNLFLQYMDGINELKGVLFIGATNHIDRIDPAILRPNRMSQIINIDMPSINDIKKIVKLYLEKENIILDKNININYLAERMNNLTGAEIKKYINLAKKIIKKENKNFLDKEISAEAYQQLTLGKKNYKINISKETLKNTAYHEASHGLLQYICHRQNESLYEFDFLTIIPRNRALGIAFSKSENEYKDPTKEKFYGMVSVALAGKAGEEIFCKMISSGPSNDLEQAFKIMQKTLLLYGMGDKLVYKDEEEWKAEINEKIQRQYRKVVKFLSENAELIEELVKQVFAKNILYSDDMKSIVSNYEKKYNKKVYFNVLN